MTADRFLAVLARRGVRLTADELDEVMFAPIGRRPLLTVGNPKTLKGRKEGFATAILHLSPHVGSGFNVCPSATVGCAAACLNTAGRGGFDPAIPAARKRRTRQFMVRREDFVARLAHEIALHAERCKREGMKAAVRLNGTSDIRWESVPAGGAPSLMDLFPGVTFYDYTKLENRKALPENYSLTFSAHEGMSDSAIVSHCEAGGNVAVVLRSREILQRSSSIKGQGILMRAMPLPDSFLDVPVVDGDKSDLRFLDPRGVIVALRAKGAAVSDSSGFVREVA